jgi:NitT/TauT family transport system substrate-binding protein
MMVAGLTLRRCRMTRFALLPLFCTLLACSRNPQQEIRLAVPRDAITFLPVHLAGTLGYYEQNGLHVSLSEVGGLARGMEALLGGSVDVSTGSAEQVIQIAAEGRRVQSFLVIYQNTSRVLVVSPAAKKKIRQIADLKGARVGISSPGSPTHLFLNYVLVTQGLTASDVSAISIGTGPSSVEAIERGQVDAAVLVGKSLPLLARRSNLAILADSRGSDGAQHVFGVASYPGAVLLSKEKWLQANPDLARRLVRAVKQAMRWMREHPAEEIRAAMNPKQRSSDAEADLQAIRDYAPTVSSEGIMPADAPAAMRKVLAVSLERVRAADIDLTQTYTNEFAAER